MDWWAALGMASERLSRLWYPGVLLAVTTLSGVLVAISLLVRSRATLEFDLQVTRALQKMDHPVATRLAHAATFMGNSSTLVVLAILGFGASLGVGLGKAGIYLGWTLFALPINMVMKNLFDRERPGERDVQVRPGPRWGFSYPSGHSMGAAALYGWLGFVAALHVREASIRHMFVILMIALPFGVAVSRVYLGAHWFSDVVGGLAAGTLLVVVLATFYPV